MADSPLIRFYKGEKNSNDVLLEDIWRWSYDSLEHVHNYIQWIFPNVEPSYIHRDTPKLTQEDIATFKADEGLLYKLFKSYLTYIDFLGLKYVDGKVVKADHYSERQKEWQTPINHNYLRITRVLHCMNTLGLPDLADALFDCMCDLVEENPENFNVTSVQYWFAAMERKGGQ